MKMNGYRATHRNKWLLIENKIITPGELLLFEYLTDAAIFDRDKDDYGVASIQVAYITKLFQYNSKGSIYPKLRKLAKIGLISQTQKGWEKILITNFSRYLLRSKPQYGTSNQHAKDEKNQPVELILQSIGITLQLIGHVDQPDEHNMSSHQTRDNSKALGSFKVSLPSSINYDGIESNLPSTDNQKLINESINEIAGKSTRESYY